MDRDGNAGAMDRRNFLRVVGSGPAMAAVVVATPLIAVGEAQAYDPGPAETKARYQVTEHVKAFYRVNGYETLKT